jgi:hypothetical protein
MPALVHADTLSLTDGNNATTTPNVATAITGFQIIGTASTITPVKLRVTSGTLNLSTVSGVTMTGNGTNTINLSGTVADINTALATLTYTRGSIGTDTLEVALVNSNQIYFPDNGHVYQYVSGSITWDNAKLAAQGLSAYGANGYLATVTSTAENNFVKARLSGDAWIGGSDSAVEGTWKWITGPETGTIFWQGTGSGGPIGGNYANWNSGEPNQAGDEDCAETYIADGTWNDLSCSTTVSGYVVEYGDNASNMPVVVAKNITITTADVPAVATLSPSNGTTSVSPTANLVITLTKAVTVQTGNILIKKVSDDSTVESIDVSGSQVTGSGTTAITIDPSASLPEGTSLYVVIPNTALKDSSNNFFDGISSASAWEFTTSDVTAPVISTVSAGSLTSTGATVTWTTNETASTKVSYGLTASYGTTTSETDTSPRVTAHSLTLSGLLACTQYHFKVTSTDGFSNTANGSDITFTTTGCSADVVPTATTSTSIDSTSGGSTTLSDSDNTITVDAPANATSASSSFVIQVKAIPNDAVLDGVGRPAAAPKEVGPVVFDVKAIVNDTTVLDSFDAPVTITYQYTDSDVIGLDESTLWLYHYHNGSWQKLDSCTVNTNSNVISCTTPGFSIFGLFGNVASTGYVSGGGRPYGVPVAVPPVIAIPVSAGTCPAYSFTRTLRKGMTGEDVRALQQFLNCAGFTLAATGPGSPGKETDMFSAKTYGAVLKFQEAYASEVLAPGGLTKGTGVFAGYSRAKAEGMMGK